jgi:hypothetical protein
MPGRGIPSDISLHSIGSGQVTSVGLGTNPREGDECLASVEGTPDAQEWAAHGDPVYNIPHTGLHDHKPPLATMVAEISGKGFQGLLVDWNECGARREMHVHLRESCSTDRSRWPWHS